MSRPDPKNETARAEIPKGIADGVTGASDPGHPLHAYRTANEAIGRAAERFQTLVAELGSPPSAARFDAAREDLVAALEKLAGVEQHYLRNDSRLFPLLERHGITAPPQVMRAVHDDVRAMLRRIRVALADGDLTTIEGDGQKLASTVQDMIYKEENILFPMALRTLDADEWTAARPAADGPTPGDAPDAIALDTGALTLEQVNLLLTHLPVDVTFVDENDEVRYYSETRNGLFPRSPAIIGRKVQDCHPPANVAAVDRVVEAFRAGTRDVAESWFTLGDRFIHIRYFAVRDGHGAYRGTIEVSQDVSSIKALEGEQRLVRWD